MTISEPGVYDLPIDEYLADPVQGGSLSSSGARLLLPPNCPALYHYRRDNPQPPKAHYDLGHAAHRLILGAGPDLAEVQADDWTTKYARQARDAARLEGKVPLLTKQLAQVVAMTQALGEHPIAARILGAQAAGKAEQALVWRDRIWRRCLLDWLPEERTDGGRLVVADYKTTTDASLTHISKAIHDYGYHQQAEWNLRGVRALELDERPAFLFVFQEKHPPHLVTVVEPDEFSLRVGKLRNDVAVEIYERCVAEDRWPGHSDDVELVSLPPWAEKEYEGTV